MGYGVGQTGDLLEDYQRATRRARAVHERLFALVTAASPTRGWSRAVAPSSSLCCCAVGLSRRARRTPPTSPRRRRAASCFAAAASCRSGPGGTPGSRPRRYSLVTPPLLGWLGPVWLGALSIVATAVVAVPLLRDARRPVCGRRLLRLAAALDVVSGRTTFALGAVVALAAVLAAERRAVGQRGVARARSPRHQPGRRLPAAGGRGRAASWPTATAAGEAAGAWSSASRSPSLRLAVLARGGRRRLRAVHQDVAADGGRHRVRRGAAPVGRRVRAAAWSDDRDAARRVLRALSDRCERDPDRGLAAAPRSCVARGRGPQLVIGRAAVVASLLPLVAAPQRPGAAPHDDDTLAAFVAPLLDAAARRPASGESPRRGRRRRDPLAVDLPAATRRAGPRLGAPGRRVAQPDVLRSRAVDRCDLPRLPRPQRGRPTSPRPGCQPARLRRDQRGASWSPPDSVT